MLRCCGNFNFIILKNAAVVGITATERLIVVSIALLGLQLFSFCATRSEVHVYEFSIYIFVEV